MSEPQDEAKQPPSRLKRAGDYLLHHWVSMIVGFVLSSIGAILVLYAFNFRHSGISDKTDDWAAFGDYVGGVLNPIVAFAALALLAYSVHIQRTELRAAQKAMREQAEHAEDMVWLSAMVAVIEYQERRMQTLSAQEESLTSDALSGYNANIVETRKELLASIRKAERRRDSLLAKVDQMVEQSPVQQLRRTIKRFGIQ